MKDKIARLKQFVKERRVPLAFAAGSVATFVILAKTDRLDIGHNYTWYSFKSHEELAKEILEQGRILIDCNHCDRVLKVIVDASEQSCNHCS